MSYLASSGVIAMIVGLFLIWQRARASRLQQSWDKRLSPKYGPLFRRSPTAYIALGASFAILGAATVIYALLARH